MLTPEQAAINKCLYDGFDVIWLAERQAGKTYLGATMIQNSQGCYMVSATPHMASAKAHTYPTNVHLSLSSPVYPQVLTKARMVVWDDFEMYSAEQLEVVLKTIQASALGRFLLMASNWPPSQLRATYLTEFVSRLSQLPKTRVFRT